MLKSVHISSNVVFSSHFSGIIYQVAPDRAATCSNLVTSAPKSLLFKFAKK